MNIKRVILECLAVILSPMILILLFIIITISLTSCTTATVEYVNKDGTTAKITTQRVLSDVGFSLDNTGSLVYSSNADTAAANALNDRLLNLLLAKALPINNNAVYTNRDLPAKLILSEESY